MTDLQTLTDEEFYSSLPDDYNNMTPEQHAEQDRRFLQSAIEGGRKEEAEWQQKGMRWSWIQLKPEWDILTHWDLYYFEVPDVWPADQKPFKRRFRLSMVGGGQIRVTERFHWWQMGPQYSPHFSADRPELYITTVVDDMLRSYHCKIDSHFCEMSYEAVVGKAPQDVLDRAAKTFRLIDCNPENFQALLAHRTRCQLCNHPLKDEVSKILTIGPSCAKKIKVPHTRATANLVLKRKRELLGDDYKDMEIPHD